MIADVLLEVFDCDLRSVVIDRRTVADAAAIARAAARVVDACQVIESSLFGARSGGCFRELRLPIGRSCEALGEFFDQHVRSVVERAPTVYMIWQRDPQRYLYVGTTQDRDGEARSPRREARGALFAALQQGSVITLMSPSPASAIGASDLEAALLAVLDRRKALPGLNVRPDDQHDNVAGALGTAYLAELGQLLHELAAKLQAPVERYRKVVG